MSEATYQSPDENKITQSTEGFKCTSCGGMTVFDPETQALKCEYCQAEYAIEPAPGTITEKDFFTVDESAEQDWGTETRVFKCSNCGGETVLDGNSVSSRCAFCGSPNVVSIDELPGIKPESVLPFKVGKKEAVNRFKAWIGKRFWAPNALKKSHTMDDNMKGIYVPHWTYDSQTYSTYNGTAGNYYYETRQVRVMVNGRPEVRTQQVQKIRWFPVSGDYSRFFDDVLINDSTNIDQTIMTNIQPFDLSKLEVYNPRFLSGFAAERYAKGVKAIWENAKNIIRSGIRSDINAIILRRADVVGNININTKYNDVTYKHMLLPVWISAYTFRGKLFNFYINGQTGEVQGRSPVSFWKVFFAILLAAAIIGLIVWLVQNSGAMGYGGYY